MKWNKRNEVSFREIVKLQRETGLSKELCELYLSRGLKSRQEIDSFNNTDIKNLEKLNTLESIQMVKDKILDKEVRLKKITIFGDYDCDGTVGTAILYDYLKQAGFDVNYYIPNRKREGYGLNKEAIRTLKNDGTEIILTVDNGISSFEEVDLIHELGMEVIITDHHEPDLLLPDTEFILDFKNESSPYFEYICGAGVSLLLIYELEKELNTGINLKKYEELVTIATVADVVELKGFNRDLVATVLNRINSNEIYNKQLKELIKISQVKALTPGTIGFRIAPMINAVGRLEDASKVVKFLSSKDSNEIKQYASEFYEKNLQRQDVERRLLDEALTVIEEERLDKNNVIVLNRPNWNKGVIGIVAGKIQEEFNRPTIVISEEDKIGHASCRSIPGFNIYEGATCS